MKVVESITTVYDITLTSAELEDVMAGLVDTMLRRGILASTEGKRAKVMFDSLVASCARLTLRMEHLDQTVDALEEKEEAYDGGV